MADEKTITLNGVEYQLDNMPDEITYQLRKPVSVGNVSIDAVELKEPNAGEYEQFSQMVNAGNHAGAVIRMISAVAIRSGTTDFSVPIVKTIGSRDMFDMSKYLQSFM